MFWPEQDVFPPSNHVRFSFYNILPVRKDVLARGSNVLARENNMVNPVYHMVIWISDMVADASHRVIPPDNVVATADHVDFIRVLCAICG